jgi:ABC-type sugar transport system permease subunit
MGFVFRPIALLLTVATIVTAAISLRRSPVNYEGDRATADRDIVMVSVLFALFAIMVVVAADYPAAARRVPWTIGIPAMLLSGWQVSREAAKRRATAKRPESAEQLQMSMAQGAALKWIFLFVLMILAGGFVAGGTLAVMVSQRFWLRESWRTTAWGGAIAFVVLRFGFERGLALPLFDGLLRTWI